MKKGWVTSHGQIEGETVWLKPPPLEWMGMGEGLEIQYHPSELASLGSKFSDSPETRGCSQLPNSWSSSGSRFGWRWKIPGWASVHPSPRKRFYDIEWVNLFIECISTRRVGISLSTPWTRISSICPFLLFQSRVQESSLRLAIP